MAFFKRNYSKKNYNIEEVGNRMTLLNAVKAEFEDTKNEAINDKELREAVVGINEHLEGQNRILERIAVSLETEKIVGKK